LNPYRVIVLLILVAPFLVCQREADAQAERARLSGGDGTLYLGGFPDKIWIIDEATETITGRIDVRSGTPRRMALSTDRTRFHLLDASLEHFEIIDITARQTIDAFTLSAGNRKARIRGYQVHPDNGSAMLIVDEATKLADRFEIAPLKLLYYDLRERRVIREVPWPDGHERPGVNMLFSPDGGLLYVFAEDVIALETDTFSEVDRWKLSQPIEPGLGRFDFGFSTSVLNEEPGYFTNVFRVQDEVQQRDLMGIARIHLAERDVDFYTLGPAVPVRVTVAPGRRKAYGLQSDIGEHEFWTFDLENRRIESRRRFAGRPRMALEVSSNGRVLYIYQAGNTIDLYDAATYQQLRTIALDGDMTTDLIVMPSPKSPR